MMPLVSAIVPVYNADRFLAEALDSALAQTFRNIEIIVVDDGSTDASGAIADHYAAAHPGRVRVIHQANAGLVPARNAAIAVARGRYLALLDADDVWLPGHLAESVDALEQDVSIGLVHANVRFIDSGSRVYGDVPKRVWRIGDDAFIEILLRRRNVACPTAVFRRSVIDEVGTFDPVFNRLGCEDRDLWLRIAQVSGLRYIDAVHAHYRTHDANMSSRIDKMQRARLLLVERYTGGNRGLRRRAVAAVHNSSGDELLCAGDRRHALVAYLRALAWRPGMRKAWWGVACCLLRWRRSASG